MIVYKLQNIVNGKSYIGKTTLSTNRRLQIHFQKARGGSQTHIHRAIRKYGEHNFSIVAFASTRIDLNLLETTCIAQELPEYNMTAGGEGGDTSNSPNYKRGMKRRRRYTGKNNPNYGKRGILSPKFGKKYGPKPNISIAKKVPVMANGRKFNSIGEAERTLHIKWYYSSRRFPKHYYTI